jgi:hypothetical protein
MKVGIYLPGLGEAYRKETGEKYAQLFMRQYDFLHEDYKPTYFLKTDIVEFDAQRKLTANRISIVEKLNDKEKLIYKFYEFKYNNTITKSFNERNALVKSLLLLKGILLKFPLLFIRLFYVGGNIGFSGKHRGQTFYLFIIFLLVSAAVVLLLPAALAIFLNFIKQDGFIKDILLGIRSILKSLPFSGNLIYFCKHTLGMQFTLAGLKSFTQVVISITSMLLILIPGFNNRIISLACEFVSASNYLNEGTTKTIIHGQLDTLIEKILEEEGAAVEICYHTYSFGSLVALDYLFPYSMPPTTRVQQYVKGLVTIGCPFDFTAIYFQAFFKNRNTFMNEKIKWINVYTLDDLLASNFRKDNKAGEPNYSISENVLLPTNVNYEMANTNKNVFTQFFTLHSIKAHTKYWGEEEDSQNCLKLIIPAMKELKIL